MMNDAFAGAPSDRDTEVPAAVYPVFVPDRESQGPSPATSMTRTLIAAISPSGAT